MMTSKKNANYYERAVRAKQLRPIPQLICEIEPTEIHSFIHNDKEHYQLVTEMV